MGFVLFYYVYIGKSMLSSEYNKDTTRARARARKIVWSL